MQLDRSSFGAENAGSFAVEVPWRFINNREASVTGRSPRLCLVNIALRALPVFAGLLPVSAK